MKINNDIKEFSWLSFNERVLQEAEDTKVPLIERLKFLGIYSSNRDEFFRVRVATIQKFAQLGQEGNKIFNIDAKKVLKQIQEIVLFQNKLFVSVYEKTIQELAKYKIFIINEKELNIEQGKYVIEYFHRKVRPTLIPIMLDNNQTFPELEEKTIYLFIVMKNNKIQRTRYALIEIPASHLPRFLILPRKGECQYIMILDDIIRYRLKDIFSAFDYDQFEAYTIKLTRDADFEIDDDLSEGIIMKVRKSLRQRKEGTLVRFTYDQEIPQDALQFLIKKFHFTKDDTIIPGRRYHNNKDFMDFPLVGPKNLYYRPLKPITHKEMSEEKILIEALKNKDFLLHFPYHSFDHFIDLLREAAIDPKVFSIKITLYRVAAQSNVINALINAIKNGKSVTAIFELQARFDEEANIYWANVLRDVGARVIYGVPGLKVHAKLCLITRKEKGHLTHYVTMGTGNFNEVTATIYCDHMLFTSDKRLTLEVATMFEFFENNYKISKFKHLIVSPFFFRKKIYKLIENEIINAINGKKAYIYIKLNNLADNAIADKIFQASNAGVEIRLIVRGMFSKIPDFIETSPNIQAISIVDKFLEHSRIMIFCNDGAEKYYVSSSDWMTRNFDHRVEVAFPIFDPEIQKELKFYFDLQWRDNVKARVLNKALDNKYQKRTTGRAIRAQEEIYNYLKKK